MKKTIAITLTFLMLFTVLPWQTMTVYAQPGQYDPTNYKVESISIGKTYDSNGALANMYIDINGTNLRDANVRIDTYEEGEQSLNQYRVANDPDFLKFEVRGDQIQDEARFLGQTIRIGGYKVDINEQEIPKVNEVTRKVEQGRFPPEGELVVKGNQLDNIVNSSLIRGQYGIPGNYNDFPVTGTYTPSEVKLSNLTGELGLQNFVFIRSTTDTHTFPGQGTEEVKVDIRHTYTNQFRLYSKLDLDGIEMQPNRGEKGDTVFFRRQDLNEYDVFFLKEMDGTDPFSNENRGKNPTYAANAEGNTDILTVQVPELPVGEYYVVLTNRVSTDNPADGINREYIMEEKFTIIDANIKSRIAEVQPSIGPDTGSKVEVIGQFFGSLNIPAFKPDGAPTVTPPTSEEPANMWVDYGTGYYNDIFISEARREITVFVGDRATFSTIELSGGDRDYEYSFDSNIDRIFVRTPQVADADVNPDKDVVVVTETTFIRADGRDPIVIRERAELADGFTYIPSAIRPEIEEVLPEKLQVVGTVGNYRVPEDRMVAIHGENFMVHRYTKENGVEVVRYPIIRLGNSVKIDKNNEGEGRDEVYLKVLNEEGEVLDGTDGREIGSKILLMVPQNQSVSNIGRTFVQVNNPIRNADTEGLYDRKTNAIEFVNPEDNQNPTINAIRPDTVAVEGGEEIVIEGRNFQPELKVFIDGEEVANVNRENTTRITFAAPPGREGTTQLQVMNPAGGMATGEFTYVRTFSDPEITDFSPKRGNTGTLVMVKGNNFLTPDPTATESSILRLIGTRVLLGDIEVNQYNRNPVTRNIELRDYLSEASNKLFSIEEESLKIADYYHSIFLQETIGQNPGRLYVVEINPNGTVTLTDGGGNNYRIGLNEERTQIIARREGGDAYAVTVEEGGIRIEDPFAPINLEMKTLYRVEGREIVGNKVRVVDENEILFTVPILEANDYYDVVIMNPDTKRDSRTGNQGFYYYTLPESRPKIHRIDPNEGAVEGGYTIDIIGEDFEYDGINKPQVIINGVEVDPQTISVDINGEVITAEVPAYPGDLRMDKGTSRLEVPVVVVNHDGGSASKGKGFAYVIPSSQPEITARLLPDRGTAAGGDVVDIRGNQFRFFEPYQDLDRTQMWNPGDPYNDLNNNGEWDDLLDIPMLEGESQEEYVARRDALWGKTPMNHREYDYYYNSPILPKVYFGNKQARIVEFERGRLRVISPAGEAGEVEVYIRNNDAGISNKVPYTYEASNPQIDRAIPNQGTRLGGDAIELHGQGFATTERQIYNGETDASGNSLYTEERVPLVRFGDISNRNIPLEEENSGRIINRSTTVQLPGELTLEYNGNTNTVRIRIQEGDNVYRSEIKGYDQSVKYMPVSLLKDEEGVSYIDRGGASYADELIRIEVDGTRFAVDRGYAPEVEYISPRQVRATSPSYYTVGNVSIIITNPDGGSDKEDFEYRSPDSKPRIVEIAKERERPNLEKITVEGREIEAKVLRMTYKGGNTLNIYGEDFRRGVWVEISNIATIPADTISMEEVENEFTVLPSTLQRLSFDMPNVGEEALDTPHRVVVRNTDGGNAYSDGLQPPIYIIFTKGESDPLINAVEPSEGPASGGTTVTLRGEDFRKEMPGFESGELQVYFGDIPVDPADIDFTDHETIRVIAPVADTFGDVDIKVQNPDGELGILENAFTYISRPKIENIDPPRIFANDVETDITITGKMFMPGAKVILGGEVMDKRNTTPDMQIMGEGINDVEEGVNITTAVVGGREAASVNVQDNNTIIVRFHEDVDLENNNVIIINPDGGISGEYDRFDYDIPVPTKPLVLEAIPGYESTVQLIWSESAPRVLNAAESYEIYGKKAGEGSYSFVGSTEEASYLVRNLEPNTSYTFMVRALNEYGGAEEFAEVTVRTLSEREDHKLQDKLDQLDEEERRLREEGREEVGGDTVIRTIGSQQIPATTHFDQQAYVIDFSTANYSSYNKFVVALPMEVVRDSAGRSITITDGIASFTLRPRDLYTREVSQVAVEDLDDAYVRVSLERIAGGEEESLSTAIPRTQTRGSRTYAIDFQLQAGRNETSIRRMLQQGELQLKQDSVIYSNARQNSLFIGRYDASQHSFTKLEDGDIASIQEAGRYTLLSNR